MLLPKKTSSDDINIFSGEHSYLSNFFKIDIIFNGLTYSSVEHAFIAHKSTDPKWQKFCAITKLTPGQLKRKGREIQLRSDWEEIKISIMEQLLRIKFSANPSITKKLLDTHNGRLLEGNWWHDNFWGQCGCDKCYNKPGKNHLGKLIIKIRDEIHMTIKE